ncbi:hypothetical protein [Nonomuraea cavernae]|uniref:Uncharacterized protein n=1 Tax=Nonomuraea cavernae TaxID=2045107 RepID=A0A917ZEP3_9ACTN|nr:hypothetical protein [Nonomuraea cavernae]MCA2190273.1 hypothetical protein [Nonomuraea cavernae]GGO80477.1 hypothetical protein GCM10012289_67220 [Nonomuraea cavernae]
MLDSLIVPLFVTTDLPPGADLAGFGELLAETARTLDHDGVSYEAFLAGKVFWLDRPVIPRQRPAADAELRFAAMLGYLAASGPGHTPAGVVADVRRAVSAAVTARYGEVGAAPAVFAIRDRDVRERTPGAALYVGTRDATPDLVTAARSYL